MKTIINRNYKGEYHGYQEWYYHQKLSYRGKWKNNIKIDYEESHTWKETIFYIK